MTADSRTFVKDVYSAVDSLKALQEASAAAQGGMSRFHFPDKTPGLTSPGASPAGASSAGSAAPSSSAGGVDNSALGGASAVAARAGSSIAAIGPQMASSLQAGLNPISHIGDVIQHQLNVVGGIIEQLARRIDASLNFKTTMGALDSLKAKFEAAFTAASAKAAAMKAPLTLAERATLALGPSATKAVGAFQGFLKLKSIFGTLTGSANMTNRSLERLNGINLATPTAGAARMANQFRTMAPAVSRVTASVKGLGLQIGLALGVVGLAYKATQALVGFFTSGIKGANDLNETMNVVKETFGGSAGEVTKFAEGMATKFGLSKNTMLEAAAGFGAIGQSAKMSEKESAAMAIQMTMLAADLTSFRHIPMADSLDKIRSGLTGETKPLKEVGVLMNEDMVKARAMTLAHKEGKMVLDEHAKMMARLSLMTEQLAKTSGDLERTQYDTANQFLKAGGGIRNFSTTIGTMLLPTVKVAVSAFNELLASVITVFEDHKPMIQTWADAMKGSFEDVAMLIRNAGDYWTIFKLQTMDSLMTVLDYVDTIPANFSLIATYLSGNWKDVVQATFTAVVTMLTNLGKNVIEFHAQLGKFLVNPMGGFEFKFTPLLEGFKATVAQLPEMIKPPLRKANDEIDKAGQRIADREQARAKSIAKIGPQEKKPSPIVDKEKTKNEYKGTAAAELGSKEANTTLAKFYNQGSGDVGKQTVDSLKMLIKVAKDTAAAIRENKNRAEAQNQGLGGFPI
jgi:hypothetical protein